MKTIPAFSAPKGNARYGTSQERWEAVLAKEAEADDHFRFAVTTTGVFCRPTCPARAPNRENVVFYATSQEAQEAGFRACRRCDPTGPGRTAQQVAKITAACRAICEAEEAPPLKELAASVGMSPFYFHRIFKQITGLTPKAYASAQRAEKVQAALPLCSTVTEAIYEAGFNSSSRFYADAFKRLGMTPTAYKNGGAGVTLRFAIGESSLGPILVASSEKGVCVISMGDDPDLLVRDLQDRFPKASLIGGDAEYENVVAKVVGLVEAPATGLDLPLDVRGSAFGLRVWKALQEIPPGKTATYAQIAISIGRPTAARAVASACAANPLAVVVPCHRVVRTDGSLSGYRWGVERKRALLEREKAQERAASASRQSDPAK